MVIQIKATVIEWLQVKWANWVLTNEGVPVLYAPDEVTETPKKRRGWLLGW